MNFSAGGGVSETSAGHKLLLPKVRGQLGGLCAFVMAAHRKGRGTPKQLQCHSRGKSIHNINYNFPDAFCYSIFEYKKINTLGSVLK